MTGVADTPRISALHPFPASSAAASYSHAVCSTCLAGILRCTCSHVRPPCTTVTASSLARQARCLTPSLPPPVPHRRSRYLPTVDQQALQQQPHHACRRAITIRRPPFDVMHAAAPRPLRHPPVSLAFVRLPLRTLRQVVQNLQSLPHAGTFTYARPSFWLKIFCCRLIWATFYFRY